MADYTTSAALKATLSLTTSFADADIAAAITAASRVIDNLCNRRFYADADALQVRYYNPYSLQRLDIDDLVTLTSLKGDSGGNGTFPDTWTLNTDFVLEPINAAADSWPYTRISTHPNGQFLFPTSFPRSVQVTGKFGWPVIPDAIVQATTVLASKLFKRAREAPFGILAIGADGAAIRLAKIDPDINSLVGPYMKHRVAVG